MKRILTLASFLISFSAFSQNGIYIVTEKFDGLFAPPTYDSVFVTNPSGVTAVQVIPHMNLNLKNHNSSLNLIFNNISQLGFKMVENGPMQLGFNTPSYYTHTWYFCQPWTTAGLEPAGDTNSQLKIIEIYPNPCNQFVTIKISKKITTAQIVIINSEGYIFHRKDISEDKITIDVSNFPPGNYIIRLLNDKCYSQAEKIVIH